eukprot:2528617-Rhodomonas_salina.1
MWYTVTGWFVCRKTFVIGGLFQLSAVSAQGDEDNVWAFWDGDSVLRIRFAIISLPLETVAVGVQRPVGVWFHLALSAQKTGNSLVMLVYVDGALVNTISRTLAQSPVMLTQEIDFCYSSPS